MVRTRSRRPLDSASGLRLLSGALAFAAGIAEPGPAAVALVAIAAGIACFRNGRSSAVWLTLPAWFALGAATVRIHKALDPIPPLMRAWRAEGFEERATPLDLEGRILDLESLAGGRLALTLRLEGWRLPAGGARHPAGGRRAHLRLTLPLPGGAPPPWIEGDRVRLSARIGRPRSFRNPAAFDYGAYLEARGVHLAGTVKSTLLVDRIEGGGAWRAALPALRRKAVANLQRAAGPGGEPTAAFLAALLVGERQSLPPDLEEALQRSGVYHIIALSGFNVWLVVILCAGLFALLPIGRRGRRIALLLAVLLYWGVARHSGSIARAALTLLVHQAGTLYGRRIAPLGALSVSALLLLAWRPAWIVDPGFQLSYAATIGLMSVLRSRPSTGASSASTTRAAGRLLTESFRASWAALLASAPFTARHFHSLAPAALLANLIAAPVGALSLVLALIVVATASWAPGLAALTSAAAGSLLRLLERAVKACAGIPGGSLFVLPPSMPLFAALASALSALALARRPLLRRLAAAAAAAMTLAVVIAGRTPRSPSGRLEVIALDVGQGDAVLTRFPNGLTLLCDAGGVLNGDFDLGARVVAPALRGLGLLRIDILAITHAHRDHLGGAASVLRQFRPRALWLGAMPAADPAASRLVALAEAAGVPVVRPRRGVRLGLGGGRIEVLHPEVGDSTSQDPTNADSLVLRIAVGDRAALLTGDAEAGVEQQLGAGHLALSADLLKVAHHGSASSTGDGFLERVRPRVALVSVGQANPFRHPSSDVIERLRRHGVCVLRTDRDGAVGAWTDGRLPWRAAPLLGARGGPEAASEHLRCGGDEAEHEDDEADDGQDVTAPGQRREVVQGPRMAGPQEGEQHAE